MKKIGLDDFLCSHSVDEFKKLPFKKIKKPQESEDSERGRRPQARCTYFIGDDGYLYASRHTQRGPVPVRIANFDGRIDREIIEDDGIERKLTYVIGGRIGNTDLLPIEVSASSFPSMSWLSQWGQRVIVEPGQTVKDTVRHAIQCRSEHVQRLVCYTHTGWRMVDGHWIYLTASGAIGAENVSIKLSRELQRYHLPQKPENEAEAIRASLSFLDIGEREVTLPLFCLLYLATMTTLLDPMPNFSGFLHGETGTYKTTLAMLLLAHFGDFNSISNLSNFEDTPNAIEKRAFILKDILLVVDDYHPSPQKGESEKKEFLAQRIIRSHSNRTGRGRLNPDTTEKGHYEPRGILLITGEELIAILSTLARLLVIEIGKDNIDTEKLSEIQSKNKLLPHAMSSFISWLKEQIGEVQEDFSKRFNELRQNASEEGVHPKLAEQTAFLQFTLSIICKWAVVKGALTEDKSRNLYHEGTKIFSNLCRKQNKMLVQEDPIEKFKEILSTLIKQGKVSLEGKQGDEKPLEQAGVSQNPEFIGYYDDDYLYLMPAALWNVIQKFCRASGFHFPISQKTLFKMLGDRKMIIRSSSGTNTKSVSVRIGGKRRVIKCLVLDREGIA